LRIDSPGQLAELWPRLRALTKRAIAQQCIVGAESAVVSYHVYLDRAGAVVAEFTGRKIRTVPAEYGFTTSLMITEDPDVMRLGREICRALALRGVAKLDFKYAPDGRLYLLEINARLSLWVHPGARAGINLPALMYADLIGKPRPAAALTRNGLRWLHPKDLLAGRRDGMSTLEWLSWARHPRPVLALWRWDDPLPLLSTMAARGRGTASGPPAVGPA
jgi:predicted ATP-grasp superfamily ATP-dependent carboligase